MHCSFALTSTSMTWHEATKSYINGTHGSDGCDFESTSTGSYLYTTGQTLRKPEWNSQSHHQGLHHFRQAILKRQAHSGSTSTWRHSRTWHTVTNFLRNDFIYLSSDGSRSWRPHTRHIGTTQCGCNRLAGTTWTTGSHFRNASCSTNGVSYAATRSTNSY